MARSCAGGLKRPVSSLLHIFDNLGFLSGMLLQIWTRNELSHVEIKDMDHPVKILLSAYAALSHLLCALEEPNAFINESACLFTKN